MILHRFLPSAAAFALPFLCASASSGQTKESASPWGLTPSAEWSGEYPRFNPLLKDAGVKWLKLFPEWAALEPKKGEFNWSPADKLVADARKNGFTVEGALLYLAPWASADGGTRKFPIKDMRDWRNYVFNVVSRYKGDIKHWEVWNEFNGTFSQNTTPATYAELVTAAHEEARRADPEAKIGLGVANFHVGYLDAAIKAGAAGHFDYVTVHPYENIEAAMEGGRSVI